MWRVGHLAGVEIDVHWSWGIAFALVTASLATAVFPPAAPGLAAAAYVALGAGAAVALFGSILLHELGHAWQARREGVTTDRVTLWVFGGIAQMRQRFPSAGAELRIAIAGPLVSLALAAVFLAAAAGLSLPAALGALVGWLGVINAILLVFNLLPALPLDGGRLLRAALWARRRDIGEATATTASVGRTVAVAMIAGGLVATIAIGFSGLWLALLGWFLLQAGAAEARAATGVDQPPGTV